MHNLIIVGMTVIMAYVLVTMDEEEQPAEKIKKESVKESSVRTRIISCTSCRKQKRHREIETNLWECPKCKRQIDLRVS